MFPTILLSTVERLSFLAIALFGIGFLIGFHELGHFLFCKLFNIITPTFSIGFGPRIFEKKINHTTFTLSAIPLGGYVEIPQEPSDAETNSPIQTPGKYFNSTPFYQKLCVMFGGIIFNLLLAYIVLIIVSTWGLPDTTLLYPYNTTNKVAAVLPDSIADKLGITVDDELIALDATPINSGKEALDYINQESAWGKNIEITIKKSLKNEPVTLAFNLREAEQKHPASSARLGIVFSTQSIPQLNAFSALQQGISLTNFFIKNTIVGYLSLFTKRSAGKLNGPLMIIAAMKQQAARGLTVFLIFLAILSVNLAILNLIPLPILDGGQIAFVVMEAAVKHKHAIHIATWAIVLLYFIYISIKEIIILSF